MTTWRFGIPEQLGPTSPLGGTVSGPEYIIGSYKKRCFDQFELLRNSTEGSVACLDSNWHNSETKSSAELVELLARWTNEGYVSAKEFWEITDFASDVTVTTNLALSDYTVLDIDPLAIWLPTNIFSATEIVLRTFDNYNYDVITRCDPTYFRSVLPRLSMKARSEFTRRILSFLSNPLQSISLPTIIGDTIRDELRYSIKLRFKIRLPISRLHLRKRAAPSTHQWVSEHLLLTGSSPPVTGTARPVTSFGFWALSLVINAQK